VVNEFLGNHQVEIVGLIVTKQGVVVWNQIIKNPRVPEELVYT
jgi:hypothetical protein